MDGVGSLGGKKISKCFGGEPVISCNKESKRREGEKETCLYGGITSIWKREYSRSMIEHIEDEVKTLGTTPEGSC